MLEIRKGVEEAIFDTTQRLRKETEQLRYRTRVSSEDHKAHTERAKAFAGSLMDFLSQDTAIRLSPMQPTSEQLRNMYFLLDAIEKKELRISDIKGIAQSKSKPYISIVYEIPWT